MKNIILITIMSVFAGTAAFADPEKGHWFTYADKKGQYTHAEVINDGYHTKYTGQIIYDVKITKQNGKTKYVSIVYDKATDEYSLGHRTRGKHAKKAFNKYLRNLT